MDAKRLLLAVLVWGGVYSSFNMVFGQEWTLTSAPITNWTGVASSANGSRLVAAAGGYYSAGPIYFSTNSGASWTPGSVLAARWLGVAAAAAVGPIYISTNSGVDWMQAGATDTNYWTAIASSADGSRLVAVAVPRHYVPGRIDTSSDWGATWTKTSAPEFRDWSSVASSADGRTLVAACWEIYLSTNSGASWDAAGLGASRVACSADGTKLVAAVYEGGIYTSADSGTTWSPTSAPNARWGSVASSADGTRLAALVTQHYLGQVYTTTNSGATWTASSPVDGGWVSVASSADGCKLVAAMTGGGIYTWQTTPMPTLNIRPSSGGLLISWIVPSMPFVLQESLDLATSDWTDVMVTPTLNLTNLHHEVLEPLSSAPRFYRLKSL